MPDVARTITIPRRPSQVWRWFESGDGSPRWQQIEQAYERGADRHQVLQSLSAAVLADV